MNGANDDALFREDVAHDDVEMGFRGVKGLTRSNVTRRIALGCFMRQPGFADCDRGAKDARPYFLRKRSGSGHASDRPYDQKQQAVKRESHLKLGNEEAHHKSFCSRHDFG